MLYLIIMDRKTCFFIGNRYTPGRIEEVLTEAVEKHIVEYGVNTFVVGHYGDFDSLVKPVLIEAKKCHPEILLYLLAPYALIQQIEAPIGFDGTFYPEGMETVPKPLAIVQANRKMVERSEYLITYCHKSYGNTRKIVEYAQRREKKGLIKVTFL